MTRRDPSPSCPRHPGSTVWRDGTYGATGRRRQRYLCIPSSEPRHRFTVPEAATDVPRGFSYTPREIAAALAAVGTGQSYRAAGRKALPRRGGRVPDGNTVADWVEVFTPAIFERSADAGWPAVLALDSLPFHARALDARGEPLPEETPAFQIFGALGVLPRGGFDLAALEAYPGASPAGSRPLWARFLRSRPGVPQHVVCDPGIVEAVEGVWPSTATTVFVCHAHLRRQLLELLRKERIDPEERLVAVAERAFDGPGHWRVFVDHPRPRRLRPLESWLDRYSERVARQLEADADRPTTVGPLERHLAVLRAQLASRRGNLRNRERTNRLLMLLQLQMSGRADDERYAQIIEEDVLAHGGSARPRRLVAEATRPSLRP